MCLTCSPLGLVYSLKAPHGFSGCRQLQATGTAKFREQWRPAWRTDISGYTYTYKKKKNFFMSTKKAQVDDIARISTSDTPRATLPPPRGGGAGHRLEGRKPVPLSNSRNMGHCVDDSPGLHVVPGPRVLSDANG